MRSVHCFQAAVVRAAGKCGDAASVAVQSLCFLSASPELKMPVMFLQGISCKEN